MKKVYKYEVPLRECIKIPKGGNILTVDFQGVDLCAWVMFAPEVSKDEFEYVRIEIYGTGHEIPMKARYIQTIFQDQFVWHVCELYRGDKPKGE